MHDWVSVRMPVDINKAGGIKLKKSGGRKYRRDLTQKNSRAEGKNRAWLHNWRQSRGRELRTGKKIKAS